MTMKQNIKILKPLNCRSVLRLLLCTALLTMITDTAEAQTKRRSRAKEKEKEENTVPFTHKLNTEIKLGNLSFNNGFGISMKSNVGYKFSNRFSLGLGGKFAYNTFATSGPDPSAFDYGGLVYGRAKIAGPIYFQAEYNLYSYQDFGGGRTDLKFPTIGLGYMQSDGGTWAYGIELLYIANDPAREYLNSVVEYWINFSHRF